MTYRPQLDKASANDTTPGYLSDKLIAGSNITFTLGSPGANETITISSTGGGGGGGGTVAMVGAYVTRLSNVVIANNTAFTFDTEIVDTDAIWDAGNPTVFTVPATGWWWVGCDMTSLGTSYGGANNADLLYAVLKNWDGVSATLGYMIIAERFANSNGASAHLNSTASPVYLTAGDELQLIVINNGASSTLIESNPSDGVPSGFLADSGPGTLSPHFYMVWIGSPTAIVQVNREILQDGNGAILTDDTGQILYTEV